MTRTGVSFAACIGVLASVAFDLPPAAEAATISTIGSIPESSVGGGGPNGGLLELGGKYYGSTSGTIYSINLKTGVGTLVYTLTSGDGGDAYELSAVAGKLYAGTQYGGTQNSGTIFQLDPATGAERVIFNNPYQTYLGVAAGPNGSLYGYGQCGGTGVSCIYKFDTGVGTGQIVYTFNSPVDGSGPVGLLLVGQYMYGATYSGGAAGNGTLFRFDPATATLKVEHVFGHGTDGSQPGAPLIDVSGVLYGATYSGGAHGDGTVFSFDPATEQEAVVYAYTARTVNGIGGLLSANGLLYGIGNELFSVDPATGQAKTIYPFQYPHDFPNFSLIEAGGLLYGTTGETGVDENGEVYAVDPATGAYTTVLNFPGGTASVTSGVIKINGSLFGTASAGGVNALGSIYKVDLATGVVKNIYSFNGSDGAHPEAGLINVAGIFYGTTSTGGPSNEGPVSSLGTVFSFDPAKHKLTTLYQFSGDENGGENGGNPVCALTLDNGALYGTTYGGPFAYFGTLFKIDLATGSLSTLLTGTSDNAIFSSGVVVGNGLLYGVGGGGAHPEGVIYQFNPATGAQTDLYAFQGGADGVSPGRLLYSNGVLFGATYTGRRAPAATAFSFDVATQTKNTFHTFQKGTNPISPLTESGNYLFGVAYSHNTPYGEVVRLNVGNGAPHLYPFTGAMGGYPEAPLLHVGQAYYGTTRSSDTTNAGTVFKFVP